MNIIMHGTPTKNLWRMMRGVDAKKSTWQWRGDEKISNYWDWVINNGRAAASKYYQKERPVNAIPRK